MKVLPWPFRKFPLVWDVLAGSFSISAHDLFTTVTHVLDLSIQLGPSHICKSGPMLSFGPFQDVSHWVCVKALNEKWKEWQFEYHRWCSHLNSQIILQRKYGTRAWLGACLGHPFRMKCFTWLRAGSLLVAVMISLAFTCKSSSFCTNAITLMSPWFCLSKWRSGNHESPSAFQTLLCSCIQLKMSIPSITMPIFADVLQL